MVKPKERLKKLEHMADTYKKMIYRQKYLKRELSNIKQKIDKQVNAIINHLIYGDEDEQGT